MSDLPSVDVTIDQNSLGLQDPSQGDALAIVGPSDSTIIDANLPLLYGRLAGVKADHVGGQLVEAAAAALHVTGRPVVLVRCAVTTAGARGSIDTSNVAGACAVTATSNTEPNDDYDPYVEILGDGTVGTDEIPYVWSLDGGRTLSGRTLLSTTGAMTAGSETSSVGSFPVSLADGDTFLGKVDQQGSADTLTIHATPATKTGSGATYAAVTAGHTLVVTLSGTQYTVVFTGSENSQATFHTTINVYIAAGGNASNASGQTKLSTSRKGSAASGSVVSGDSDVLASLGLSVGSFTNAGPNNVAILSAVTAAEFADLLTATFTGGTAGSTGTAISEDRVKWATNTAGASPKGVKFTGGTGVSKIAGFDTSEHNGTAAAFRIVFPGNVGVSYDLTADTLKKGDYWTERTSAPKPSDSQYDAALAALQNAKYTYESILILGDITHTATVNVFKTRFETMLAAYKYKKLFIHFRMPDDGESESAYLAAFRAVFDAVNCFGISASAGALEYQSLASEAPSLRTYRRPPAWLAAPMHVKLGPAVSLAYVQDGQGAWPLGATIKDENGNPKYHDESLDPGLDAARALTLRSQPFYNGVFVTRARMLAQSGTNFMFLQFWAAQIKVMDVAVRKAVGQIQGQIVPDPETGRVLEAFAADFDRSVEDAIANEVADRGWIVKAPGKSPKVRMDRTVNVFKTPQIPVEVTAIPFGYNDGFSMRFALTNPGFQGG